jgi:hypothetical protein
MSGISRRGILTTLPAAAWSIPWMLGTSASAQPAESSTYPEFPAQQPDRVKEMVGVSHGNKERVRALLEESPALAKATWDWGFGDWETALGAASHTGGREIAHMLLSHGARPDIFTFAMLGSLDVVRSCIVALPGIQRIKGPHGLTLMHHARQGGKEAESVVAYLEEVGDADIRVNSLPLTDEDKAQYIGLFSFGPASTDTLEVFVSKAEVLSIKRSPDGAARTIYYLGNHEFHPVGAEAVRIRFEVRNGESTSLTVVDGPSQIIARRRV